MSYILVPPAKLDLQILARGPYGLEILMECSVIHNVHFLILCISKNRKKCTK